MPFKNQAAGDKYFAQQMEKAVANMKEQGLLPKDFDSKTDISNSNGYDGFRQNTPDADVKQKFPDMPTVDTPSGGSWISDLAKGFSKVAKVLGPVGVIGAGIETVLLGKEAQAAIGDNPEAMAEYAAVLGAHAGQMTWDPSLVGGEVAIQKWFDSFAERHGLSPEVAETLRPSSVLRDITGSSRMSSEMNLFHKVYDRIPDDLSETMSPELQTMVQLKQQIEAAGENFDKVRTSIPVDMVAKQEAEKALEEAQKRYTEQYDEYAQSGALQEHVMPEIDMKDVAMNQQQPSQEAEATQHAAMDVDQSTTGPAQSAPGLG